MKKFKAVPFGFLLTSLLLVLSGCAEFSGIRQPLYDNQPVEANEEAIETYQASREITGDEKDYYLRTAFSQDIYRPSADYVDHAPELLTTGEYVIGEDLPAGRVSLFGNESSFTSENYDVHIGNLVIYDEAGEVYFENLFHSLYGPLTAQVDFLPGHTVEIVGTDAEITAFYSPEFPEDPYVLMSPPEVIENQGLMEVQPPLTTIEEEDLVIVSAGIYEVGVHLEPGTYELMNVYAPHNTEMYVFQDGREPRVIELLLEELVIYVDEEGAEEAVQEEENYPQLVLKDGDKIYPNLVEALLLQKVE